MAKRQRRVRINTEKVQGEGSYAVITKLTVAEMRKAREAVDAELTDLQQFELGVDILRTHVHEWNWVDDNDIAMPMPKDEPAIVDTLFDEEVKILTLAIRGSDDDVKN